MNYYQKEFFIIIPYKRKDLQTKYKTFHQSNYTIASSIFLFTTFEV